MPLYKNCMNMLEMLFTRGDINSLGMVHSRLGKARSDSQLHVHKL